jgi:hypothetical protein
MAEEAASCELLSAISPANREKYREFHSFRASIWEITPNRTVL